MSQLIIFKNLSPNLAVIKETNNIEILNIDMSDDDLVLRYHPTSVVSKLMIKMEIFYMSMIASTAAQ